MKNNVMFIKKKKEVYRDFEIIFMHQCTIFIILYLFIQLNKSYFYALDSFIMFGF